MPKKKKAQHKTKDRGKRSSEQNTKRKKKRAKDGPGTFSPFGTGGVDDIQLLEDYGDASELSRKQRLITNPKTGFVLHASIRLEANDAAIVEGFLTATPKADAQLDLVVPWVKQHGLFKVKDKSFYLNLLQSVLDAQVPPTGDGEAPSEPDGVSRLRIVHEFHDQSGTPRYWLEIRMRVTLDQATDFTAVRQFLAGAGGLTATQKLLTSTRIIYTLDPRISGLDENGNYNPTEYADAYKKLVSLMF